MINIQYYTTNQWGNPREIIHPNNKDWATAYKMLTGKTTLTPLQRALCIELSGNNITFTEVLQPQKTL